MKTIIEVTGIAISVLKEILDNPNPLCNSVIINAWTKYVPKLYFDNLLIILHFLSLITVLDSRFLINTNTDKVSSTTFTEKLL